jgi:hypothetical protein
VSIAEEAFDQRLNPIRASVELRLRTLDAKELKAAGGVFEVLDIANLIAKEGLSRLNSVATFEQVIGAAAFTVGSSL